MAKISANLVKTCIYGAVCRNLVCIILAMLGQANKNLI